MGWLDRRQLEPQNLSMVVVRSMDIRRQIIIQFKGKHIHWYGSTRFQLNDSN
jgi:hypothetical protein